ncbi:diguanylate cyclase (GGDEF) domain-containing protein [Franzmannia pantelleriensis]|uniref:Diguanylate cyclase (GGDEF) domain-containing protein n=1 Tax=Franzmannia pantelleriensis TaxID=48727 RepID=A0A1G9GHB3_9GAMM|nr:EAL domain-containing protein [Halomonas pantelleriensis]SDL00071.1 diguanylate cyclase (GGDEF) domain-containing protein [Halomonas pantelleriensis]
MNVESKRLLVVDDNPINVEMLLDLLDDHGFDNLEGITDSRQVIARCEACKPDLVLLDIRMPYLNGHAVIEQLQQTYGEHAPAVIVLTAQVDDETRYRALDLGVRDFLTKPFQHDEVLQRIRNTLFVQHRFDVRDKQAEVLERLVAKRTQAIEQQSRTDPITQLPNRRGLLQVLRDGAIAHHSIGLLFISLDGLDDIIRLHGYATSEGFLRLVGRRIEALLSAHQCIGLWGGSELLVVDRAPHSKTALHGLAQRLLALLDQDLALDELLLRVEARIGISYATQHISDPERLVHMAALALPNLPGSRIRQHSPALESSQLQRLRLQQALKGAAQRGELQLVYQPKVDLASGRPIGAEALLRWQHPELGAISPAEFIPLAEASGDILAIGDWVIDEAMRQAVAWQQLPGAEDNFEIAVNIAARQLGRRDFAERLLNRFEDLGLPTRRLSLEVTESGLMLDVGLARRLLTRLASAGIKVAIDDFGTGYSSLAYLKTLPVATLKIDRAFVYDLESSAEDRNLAATVIAMAHGFGCNVVAEGIETTEQAAMLARMGCEAAQGYYFARPLPAEEFADWYCGQQDNQALLQR